MIKQNSAILFTFQFLFFFPGESYQRASTPQSRVGGEDDSDVDSNFQLEANKSASDDSATSSGISCFDLA